MKTKQYGVWTEEQDGEETYGYWMLFDNIEDAVNEYSDEPVYELNAKFLGFYKRKVSLVKTKKKGKKKK